MAGRCLARGLQPCGCHCGRELYNQVLGWPMAWTSDTPGAWTRLLGNRWMRVSTSRLIHCCLGLIPTSICLIAERSSNSAWGSMCQSLQGENQAKPSIECPDSSVACRSQTGRMRPLQLRSISSLTTVSAFTDLSGWSSKPTNNWSRSQAQERANPGHLF